MLCPKCGYTDFYAEAACPRCAFRGPLARLEKLAALDFLLAELDTWADLPAVPHQALRQKYQRQRQALEVELGLAAQSLSVEEAAAARRDLARLEYVRSAVPNLQRRGLELPAEIRADLEKRIISLQARLQGAPPTAPLPVNEAALDYNRFLAHSLRQWQALGKLPSSRPLREILQMLDDEARWREEQIKSSAVEAAFPRGAPAPQAVAPPAAPPPPGAAALPKETPRPKVAPPPPAAPPRPPRQPWTWERLWETLLSERTINAMLFVGVTLLVAAAVSLVVWNWDAFPPWLQVTFLALFTGLFYGLGWYVRVRLKLSGSGVALSAFASLLVPLDFYAFYLSGGFPRERWPEVWLGASIVCLLVYLFTAYLVQAEFFGYLVGLAAGSLLAAALRLAHVDVTWWQAALSALALAVGALGEALFRFGRGRWKVLAAPLWRLALVAAAVILALHFGWGFTIRSGDLDFRLALALDAWLAGLLYLLAVWRLPGRTFSLAAALCFPLAALLTEGVYFPPARLGLTWYALGPALMAPLYLALGQYAARPGAPASWRIPAETAGGVGRLLVLVSAVWALFNADVAVYVHPWLALTLVLMARWQRSPRWLYLTGLLLFTGGAAFVASRGLPLAQMGLAWALLALLLAAAAYRLERRKPAAEASIPRLDYGAPLYVCAWLAAALALLPPLVFTDRSLLAYVLGHWAAFNGWLALLRHEGSLAAAGAWLQRRRLPDTAFQWLAAFGLPVWVLQLWFNLPAPRPHLELIALLLAWALLGWGQLLRRARPAYSRPWHTVAQVCAAAAVCMAAFAEQPWPAGIWLGAAAFYFTAARLQRVRFWFWPGGVLFPAGLILALDWLHVDSRAFPAALAGVALVYFLGGKALERLCGWGRDFLSPLYSLAYGVSSAAFAVGLWILAFGERTDSELLWIAASNVILAAAFAAWAWLENDRVSAYLSVWLAAVAFGLAASAYSRGSGRSAALAALLALAYVLLERGLRWGTRRHTARITFRRAWRLYRWPLLTTGWAVSAFTVLLALGRNLVLLGGGRVQATWAAVALGLVAALYAASAWLYFRWRLAPHFAGLAAALAVLPWSVLTYLGWYVWPQPPAAHYGLAWAVLALLEWLAALALAARCGWQRGSRLFAFSRQMADVTHGLLPFALVWGLGEAWVSSLTFGLGVGYYLLATWLDRRMQPERVRARFAYPAAWLLPIWAMQLLRYFQPEATRLQYGFVLLGFALPALAVGRWLARHQPAYRWALYGLAYGVLLPGTALVAHERPALIAACLLWTVMMALSAWTFRQPVWVYPATAALAVAWGLGMMEMGLARDYQQGVSLMYPYGWGFLSDGTALVQIDSKVPLMYPYGWGFLLLAALYLLGAFGLRRDWAGPPGAPLSEGAASPRSGFFRECAVPLAAAAFALIAVAIPYFRNHFIGILVGYAGAALLLGFAAAWLRQPLLLTPALALTGLAYWRALAEWQPADYGLALWPWIAAALAAAYLCDRWLRPAGEPAFPWGNLLAWPEALARRWLNGWAFPFYAGAYAAATYTILLSLGDERYGLMNAMLAAAVYALALERFRLRGWLLALAAALQLAAVHAIRWWGGGAGSFADLMLAFAPALWITLLVGVFLERHLGEGPLNLLTLWRGWSRPLYWLLGLDLLVSQFACINFDAASAWLALSNTLALVVLATQWQSRLMAALAQLGGLITLALALSWWQVDSLTWPWAIMLLALGYGLPGYALRYWRNAGGAGNMFQFWERTLCWGGWVLSAFSLYLTWMLGFDVLRLALRAAVGLPLALRDEIGQVQMTVAVLALVGVFILTVAVVERKRWVAYGAMVFLLGAWSLEWLLVWGQREIQWYVIPVGLYLLAIGYLEWRYGGPAGRALARWVDRAAMLLLLGSSFWQSLGDHGGSYALLMGAEALLLAWWGSARRLRRFLYSGVVALVLDVAGQLVDPLLSANRWIVFGVSGLVIVSLAIFVERRLRAVDRRLAEAFPLAEQLRKRLEDWE